MDKDSLEGILHFLDWSAVDFSTATTAIPLIGSIGIAMALFRIVRAHEGNAPPDFPFSKKFNEWIILVGFAGTVCGLIFSLSGEKSLTSEKVMSLLTDLFLGLDTALWSTLMALLWVGLVNYPLSVLMRWLYDRSAEPFGEQAPIIEKFEKLGDSVKHAGIQIHSIAGESGQTKRALKSLADKTDYLTGNLDKLSATLDGLLNKHERITADGFVRILTSVNGVLEKVADGLGAFNETKEMVNHIKAISNEQKKSFDTLAEELKLSRIAFEKNDEARKTLMEEKMAETSKLADEAILKAESAERRAKTAEDDAAQVKWKLENIKGALK